MSPGPYCKNHFRSHDVWQSDLPSLELKPLEGRRQEGPWSSYFVFLVVCCVVFMARCCWFIVCYWSNSDLNEGYKCRLKYFNTIKYKILPWQLNSYEGSDGNNKSNLLVAVWHRNMNKNEKNTKDNHNHNYPHHGKPPPPSMWIFYLQPSSINSSWMRS